MPGRAGTGVVEGARAHAAASDCEHVRGRWGQPVNTLTSGAYLAAAAWLTSRPLPRRTLWVTVLAALGAGSIGYHGPGGRVGHAVHDASIVAAIAAGASRPLENRHAVAAGTVLAAAATVHAASRTGRRACMPESVWQGHGLWHLLSAVAVVLWATGEPA